MRKIFSRSAKPKTAAPATDDTIDLLGETALSTPARGWREVVGHLCDRTRDMFLHSPTRKQDLALAAITLVGVAAEVAMAGTFNHLFGASMDALATSNGVAFAKAMAEYFGILMPVAGIAKAASSAAQARLENHWAQFEYEKLRQRLIAHDAYAGLTEKDHPEQVLVGDTQEIPNKTLNLGLSFLASVGRIAIYTPLLFSVGALNIEVPATVLRSVVAAANSFVSLIPGGPSLGLHFVAAAHPMSLHLGAGYLPGVLAAYAGLSAGLTYAVARKMPEIFGRMNKHGNTLRNRFVNLSKEGDAVAMSGGVRAEEGFIQDVFHKLQENNFEQIRKSTELQAIGAMVMTMNGGVADLAVAPYRLLTKTPISLGKMTQVTSAFMMTTWMIDNTIKSFSDAQQLRSIIDRKISFEAKLDRLHKDAIARAEHALAETTPLPDDSPLVIDMQNLSVALPAKEGDAKTEDELLIAPFDLSLRSGDWLAITGKRGCGKSTILRILAGLRPAATGGISVRPGISRVVLAQTAPLLGNTIKDIVCFGENRGAKDFSDAEVAAAIAKVGLSERLLPRLHDPNTHDLRDLHRRNATDIVAKLSGGQRQSLALAQAFLRKPDLLISDEGTSALDPETQMDVLRRFKNENPHTAVISITHRPEVVAMHSLHADIRDKTLSCRRVLSLYALKKPPQGTLRAAFVEDSESDDFAMPDAAPEWGMMPTPA